MREEDQASAPARTIRAAPPKKREGNGPSKGKYRQSKKGLIGISSAQQSEGTAFMRRLRETTPRIPSKKKPRTGEGGKKNLAPEKPLLRKVEPTRTTKERGLRKKAPSEREELKKSSNHDSKKENEVFSSEGFSSVHETRT